MATLTLCSLRQRAHAQINRAFFINPNPIDKKLVYKKHTFLSLHHSPKRQTETLKVTTRMQAATSSFLFTGSAFSLDDQRKRGTSGSQAKSSAIDAKIPYGIPIRIPFSEHQKDNVAS
jgi:predicted nucleic acid-binding Zn ribbon protein